MPIQYINELLGLSELQLHSVVSIHETEVHLEASPVAFKQACPLCHSEEAVKRNGRNTPRKIGHVSIFGIYQIAVSSSEPVNPLDSKHHWQHGGFSMTT
jgi:hypothetical protein